MASDNNFIARIRKDIRNGCGIVSNALIFYFENFKLRHALITNKQDAFQRKLDAV